MPAARNSRNAREFEVCWDLFQYAPKQQRPLEDAVEAMNSNKEESVHVK